MTGVHRDVTFDYTEQEENKGSINPVILNTYTTGVQSLLTEILELKEKGVSKYQRILLERILESPKVYHGTLEGRKGVVVPEADLFVDEDLWSTHVVYTGLYWVNKEGKKIV